MRFAVASVLSLLVHGLLAVMLLAAMRLAPEPDALVELDLSSVELSFAETEEAAARPVFTPMPAAAPAARPPAPVPPPEVEKPLSRPPEPDAPRLPEPQPDRPSVETPERPPARAESSASSAPSVAAPAPRQARVDAPPSPRRTIRPDYPKGARLRGEQGDVTVEIAVSAQGAVELASVVISSGFRELDAAAVRAVKAARFRPARSARGEVPAMARVTLSFRLR